ncbi:hypothetical protein JCM10213_007791 [Rhodosporidiobolus nylandii]
MISPPPETPVTPGPLTPQLSLSLRLRFLEQLLRPTSSPAHTSPAPSAVPLARRIGQVQEQLRTALGGAAGSGGQGSAGAGGGSEAVRRFVQNYDLNAPLLSVAPVPFDAGAEGEATSPKAKVALILEAEQEIRQLEKELRGIAVVDERGVVGAGKLGEHESLKPTLAALRTSTQPVSSAYSSLEARTTALLQQYNDYISTLSELFVTWNDVLSEAEDAVTKLEREQAKGGEYDIL